MSDAVVERFPGTGGYAMPVLAGAFAAMLVGISVLDGVQAVDVPVLAGCVLGAVVVWVVFVRPAVRVVGEDLVLRGALGEATIPLAAVERVTITRMLVVQAGARRHVSTALSRTLRSSMSSGGMAAGRSGGAGLGLIGGAARRAGSDGAGDPDPDHDALGKAAYPDFVEDRLLALAESARARRGIRLLSTEQDALAAGVRRTWSPAPIGALAGATALFAASLLLL